MNKIPSLTVRAGRAAAASFILASLATGACAGGLGGNVTQGTATTALPAYNWEGFYAGATLGGGIFAAEPSELNDTFTNDAPNVSDPSAAYGLRAGYNWAPFDDNLIIGAEIDATFGLMSEELVKTNASGTDGLNFENSWESVISIRARAGVASGKVLTYVAGGPAFANINYVAEDLDTVTTGCEQNVCGELSETLIGLTIGAGIEYAFREDWVGSFEFMHYAMPATKAPILTARDEGTCTQGQADDCTIFFDSSATTVRIGISYRF